MKPNKHEIKLAKLFATEAKNRLEANINGINSKEGSARDKLVTGIANDILKEERFIAPHPLGV